VFDNYLVRPPEDRRDKGGPKMGRGGRGRRETKERDEGWEASPPKYI